MPGTDGQIVFEVTADGTRAIGDIRELTRLIQQETRNWDDAAEEASEDMGNSFTSMLKKVGSAIAAAKIGQKLIEIGKEAIDLASDLEEVQNVVDVTFGSDAGKIDTWAKNAASQFGLTETQAKKFTSTLGAMMKSSGLAGSQITDMSTDLAGLAADMASFYNLDFETAFQKIRSGISGETEPLKQLGINMSVANLNAYALKQGLEKTFEQMSQGEQTMLRYQYMMDATADAQGDFARTSDGYANSLRLLETNLTTLKTTLGTTLVDMANDLVGALNGLFGSEAKSKWEEFSLLDQINAIQIEKEEKIAQIQAIAEEANALISVLDSLSGKDAGTVLTDLATGANSLDSGSQSHWAGVLGALQGIDGLENLFGNGETATNTVSDLAAALSGNSITTSKAEAWDTFLSALADNADGVAKLTGKSVDETKEWLHGLATTAHDLNPEDAAAWQTLMNALVSGIDLNSEEGQKFISGLATQFLAMGSGSEEAAAGLAALGYSTDDIQEKQAAWLEVCKQLSQTMPGISDLIDNQTGEIKGGLPALQEYVKEWEELQTLQAELAALQSMEDLYNKENNVGTKKGKEAAARAIYEQRLIRELGIEEEVAKNITKLLTAAAELGGDITEDAALFEAAAVRAGLNGEDAIIAYTAYVGKILASMKNDTVQTALEDWLVALNERITTEKELPAVLDELHEEQQQLEDDYNAGIDELKEMAGAADAAAESVSKLTKAAQGDEQAISDITEVINGATEALKELADYTDSVHAKILSSIDGVAKGFEKIETPMMKNAREMRDIQAQIDGLDSSSKTYTEDLSKLNAEMNKGTAQKISAQSMAENLKQQAEYMETYMENLRKARALGVSDAVLATLSDGSEESYDYLAALAEATPGEVEKINKGFEDVAQKKKALADELTGQQLTVDETYKTLAEAAKQAVAELDLEQEAADNAGKTVGGIARGISEKVPTLQTAVDEVIAQLERLQGFGIDFSLGNFGQVTGTGGNQEVNNGWITLYSHKNGLDWVPFDNYFARLHEGEAVLTAEENKVWQSLRNGTALNMDYDSLGGVMRDNIRPGGSVYLDGKVVGRVISDGQGSAYRSLQRSGWQQ